MARVDPPLEHAAMIVDNGRIRWVGPGAQLKTPAGAEAITLTGKFVMPGIINLHGHVGNTSRPEAGCQIFHAREYRKQSEDLC